jgi:predicted nucleic acid-binding Zn ribbon protein
MTDRARKRKPARSRVAPNTASSTVDGGQPADPVDNASIIHRGVPDPAYFVHQNDPQAVDNPPEGADDGADHDLARSLLADLRAGRGDLSTRRGRDGRRSVRDRNRRDNMAGRNRGGYSGARHDPERDPHLLGELVAGFVDEQGWSRPLADARVFAEWPLLVGAEVAAHCSPQSLRDGELRVSAESTAWATQLRLLTAVMLSRLAAELGPAVVRRIVVTGPVAPSWKHGGWSVRGARGPRDTYG